jgi:hypothetical protein
VVFEEEVERAVRGTIMREMQGQHRGGKSRGRGGKDLPVRLVFCFSSVISGPEFYKCFSYV